MGKYFTIDELCRSEKARSLAMENKPNREEKANMDLLIKYILDPLRESWGKAIRVTSGFRCQKLNAIIGSRDTSQHTTGQAADITTGNAVENRKLFMMILDLKLPFDQLIDENNFSWIHVSYAHNKNRGQILKL